MAFKKVVGLFQRLVADQQISTVLFKKWSSKLQSDPVVENSPQKADHRAAKNDHPDFIFPLAAR